MVPQRQGGGGQDGVAAVVDQPALAERVAVPSHAGPDGHRGEDVVDEGTAFVGVGGGEDRVESVGDVDQRPLVPPDRRLEEPHPTRHVRGRRVGVALLARL